jgi:hypothetical protein
VILAILLATATAAPATAPHTDYRAEIGAGKRLCSNPDPVNKTCAIIDSFTPAADGAMTDTGEALLAPEPRVTLETSATVHINGATNCGMLELADLQKGRVRVNGELLPPDRNAFAIGKIVEKMGSLAGHKVCETLHVDGGTLVKSQIIEGTDIKIPDMPAAWIAPGDGYQVAASSVPAAAPAQ